MINVIEYKGYIIDYIPKKRGYRVYWANHCFPMLYLSVDEAKQAIDKGI